MEGAKFSKYFQIHFYSVISFPFVMMSRALIVLNAYLDFHLLLLDRVDPMVNLFQDKTPKTKPERSTDPRAFFQNDDSITLHQGEVES